MIHTLGKFCTSVTIANSELDEGIGYRLILNPFWIPESAICVILIVLPVFVTCSSIIVYLLPPALVGTE